MTNQDKNNQPQPPQQQPVQTQRKPNEQVGFHLSGSLTIKDPQTGEVLVKMRAD